MMRTSSPRRALSRPHALQAIHGGGFLVVLLAALGALFLAGCGVGADAEAASDAGVAAAPEAPVAERTPIPLDHEDPIAMRVYASPTCGCCSLWVDHLEERGFEVETVYRDDMVAVKQNFGVKDRLASCHTGVVNGYVIEGHVPAEDIRRLLAETPEVRGLAVPGMPIGSPGMEMGDRIDPYDVLTFDAAGATTVWASHGR
jgi:hypothetical protein